MGVACVSCVAERDWVFCGIILCEEGAGLGLAVDWVSDTTLLGGTGGALARDKGGVVSPILVALRWGSAFVLFG